MARAHSSSHLTPGKLSRSVRAQPFIQHFAGCQLCSGLTQPAYASRDACAAALEEALSFSEDWALAELGLRHVNLSGTAVEKGDGRPPAWPAEGDSGEGGEQAGGEAGVAEEDRGGGGGLEEEGAQPKPPAEGGDAGGAPAR